MSYDSRPMAADHRHGPDRRRGDPDRRAGLVDVVSQQHTDLLVHLNRLLGDMQWSSDRPQHVWAARLEAIIGDHRRLPGHDRRGS